MERRASTDRVTGDAVTSGFLAVFSIWLPASFNTKKTLTVSDGIKNETTLHVSVGVLGENA